MKLQVFAHRNKPARHLIAIGFTLRGIVLYVRTIPKESAVDPTLLPRKAIWYAVRDLLVVDEVFGIATNELEALLNELARLR